MRSRLRSSLLWGLVGALAFLVLAQGYVFLADGVGLSVLSALGVALAVGVAATIVTYLTEYRLARKGRT